MYIYIYIYIVVTQKKKEKKISMERAEVKGRRSDRRKAEGGGR